MCSSGVNNARSSNGDSRRLAGKEHNVLNVSLAPTPQTPQCLTACKNGRVCFGTGGWSGALCVQPQWSPCPCWCQYAEVPPRTPPTQTGRLTAHSPACLFWWMAASIQAVGGRKEGLGPGVLRNCSICSLKERGHKPLTQESRTRPLAPCTPQTLRSDTRQAVFIALRWRCVLVWMRSVCSSLGTTMKWVLIKIVL